MRRPGAWKLSGLVAARCDASPRMMAAWPWPVVRRTIIRLATWLELAGGLGIADVHGTAVLCSSPPRLRDRVRLVLVMGAVVLVGAAGAMAILIVWWPLLVVAAAAWLVVMAPASLLAWRCREPERRLRSARPVGGWCIRNFAADTGHRGAGRNLLAAVCAKADDDGRVLYLDTSAPQLVGYYRQFGFAVVASEALRSGHHVWTVFRLVRPAAPAPQH